MSKYRVISKEKKSAGTCLLDEQQACIDCGECDRCDLMPEKICDNCGKCLNGADYNGIVITKIIDS